MDLVESNINNKSKGEGVFFKDNLSSETNSKSESNSKEVKTGDQVQLNNSLLEKWFADTQSTPCVQDKDNLNISEKIKENILNDYFDDIHQPKTNLEKSLFNKHENIEDPDTDCKEKSEVKVNDPDIFQFLNDQSDIQETPSIKPIHVLGESNEDENNNGNSEVYTTKSNYINLDHPFKDIDNKDAVNLDFDKMLLDINKIIDKKDAVNYDLDKMLLDINKNIEDSANNLKCYNQNLLENLSKPQNIKKNDNGEINELEFNCKHNNQENNKEDCNEPNPKNDCINIIEYNKINLENSSLLMKSNHLDSYKIIPPNDSFVDKNDFQLLKSKVRNPSMTENISNRFNSAVNINAKYYDPSLIKKRELESELQEKNKSLYLPEQQNTILGSNKNIFDYSESELNSDRDSEMPVINNSLLSQTKNSNIVNSMIEKIRFPINSNLEKSTVTNLLSNTNKEIGLEDGLLVEENKQEIQLIKKKEEINSQFDVKNDYSALNQSKNSRIGDSEIQKINASPKIKEEEESGHNFFNKTINEIYYEEGKSLVEDKNVETFGIENNINIGLNRSCNTSNKKDDEPYDFEKYGIQSLLDIKNETSVLKENENKNDKENDIVNCSLTEEGTNLNNPNINVVEVGRVSRPFKIEEEKEEIKSEIKETKVDSTNKNASTKQINKQFTFYNKFVQANVEGNNTYFKGMELNGNQTNTEVIENNDFETIDVNMMSSSNFKITQSLVQSNNELTTTAKFNPLESNHFEFSVGRQSEAHLLSNSHANEQTFKPSIKDNFRCKDVNSLESIEEKPNNSFKKNNSENEFSLLGKKSINEKEGNHKSDNNTRNDDFSHVNVEEKNLVTIKSYTNSPDKLSQNFLDYDAIYLNLQVPEKEVDRNDQRDIKKINQYSYTEPESKLIEKEPFSLADILPNNNDSLPVKINETCNAPLENSLQKIKLDYKRQISEKYYGKITIGKENEKNLKQKKDFIFLDKVFTELKNSNIKISFDKMPDYNNVTEDFVNVELNKIFKNLNVDEISKKLEDFSINDELNRISFRSLYKIDDIGYFAGLSEMAIYLKEAFKECTKISILKADGNNFYRSFMFVLLENHVLRKNLYEIRKIALDFYLTIDFKFKRYNAIIDKTLCLTIFKLIIDLIVLKETKNAYMSFCKALILYPNFDLALVKYIRIALGKFLDANKEIIYNEDNYNIIEYLSHCAYKRDKEKIFNMTGFIEENILSMHNEAEQLMYYLAPIVFNINMELYVLEGSLNNDPLNASFFKEIISCQNNNREKLTLLYRFNHFDVLYTNTTYTAYKDIIDIFITTETLKSKARIKQLKSTACDNCKKITINIELSDHQIASTCRDCLTAFIKDRMIERVKNYSAENYNNLEYYCRPLNLNEEKLLYEEDFLILTGKTITQYVVSVLDILCESCMKEFNPKDFSILACFCKVCKNCLIKKLKLASDELVILNTYEQKFIKLKTIACFCYNEFNYIDAVNTFNEIVVIDYIKASNQRLSEQVQGFCMECESSVLKVNQITKNGKISYFPVKILDNNNKTNSNHILCSTCLKNLTLNTKSGNLITSLHCNLCDLIHIIDQKIWDNKTSNDKKCLCDCIIF